MGFLKVLIGLPFILVVLVFAFVNNSMVAFSLWPTGIEITVSLSVAIVFLVIIGYIAGWLSAWMSYSGIRSELRAHKKQNKKLSKEVEGLHGNIETLKAAAPVVEEKKQTFKDRIKKAFGLGSKKAEK